jgi:hypothetical protein
MVELIAFGHIGVGTGGKTCGPSDVASGSGRIQCYRRQRCRGKYWSGDGRDHDCWIV